MLGGSFWVAFFRNGMGAVLLMAVFLLLDRPRKSMKRTVRWYILFGCLFALLFSIWYVLDRESFVRFGGISCIPFTGGFGIWMSREKLYLSLYKIALGFYFLAIVVFCGVDASRIWFGGDKWADIVIRFLMISAILFLIIRKIRRSFLDSVDILEEEMDLFSVVTLFISIGIAALVAFWPSDHVFSIFNIVRTLVLLIMAGLIQYMMFRMYLHQGREHRYQVEKELLEMNEQLLHRQMELMREAEEEAARIRHDIRHHCLLMEEYIRNKECDKLLAYVKEYGEEVERNKTERISSNETINSILSAYGRYAKEEKIHIVMDVKVAEHLEVRDIDLVAILANVVENAIHGCLGAETKKREIQLFIIQKGNKIAIQCKNTCSRNIKFHKGLPESAGGIGVSSIRKVASYYNGETDFSMEDGMFVVRILMNIPALHGAVYEI